jgi:hypothetical protein
VRANASAFAEYLERALEIAHRALYPATVATDGANSAPRWRKLKRIMRGRTSSMALAPKKWEEPASSIDESVAPLRGD